MPYETHHDGLPIDLINGTARQGHIDTSFEILEDLFGVPMPGDGYRTDAEWLIKTEAGTTITIYNWCNGKAFLGPHGTPVELITRWNVGGHSKLVMGQIRELLAMITKEAA